MPKQSEVEELLVALRNETIVNWEHVNLHRIYDFTKLGMKKTPKFDMTKISQLKFTSAAQKLNIYTKNGPNSDLARFGFEDLI
jgi:hypothetical protein